ncbi:MAG: ParB/RepB/Spo0J family partition protein [Candidatus Saccharimonadales bacterium]
MNSLIQEIPIDQFELSFGEMRIINPEHVLRIQNSMYVHGQLQPVVARPFEGRYQVIDGIKRVYAAIELVIERLQCYVLDVDLQQAKVLVLSYNRPYQSMEVWEEAMVLADLADRHGLSQQSLARLTGYSRSWVSRRLSLISRISDQLATEIRMGVISTSQARALVKLPRGNQVEVARVINSWGLASRQSDALVEAFLKAKDGDKQRQILAHPEDVLTGRSPEPACDIDDQRLSGDGNDLMKATRYALSAIKSILSSLHAGHIGALKETEKILITPEIEKLGRYAKKLTKAIADLQIHKPTTAG